MERTLAIIKPDAVEKNYVGRILARIEEEGFTIVAMRMIRMTRKEAEGFYAVHRERPFFGDLTAYMSSGPAVVMVLEKDDAIAVWRKVMGATNPAEAEEGTIRKLFGESIERNATHGSDATETSAFETAYFFSGVDRIDAR
ncbi:MAG: nucleoside-diphosphate kinase [Acidobacteriota bacterium]|nr:nucleoside-diphosphate kinase [Acidobacteriota bacterium]